MSANDARALLHLANCHSTNVGNGALIEGTEAVLNRDLPVAINWRREAWDDYTFETKRFDREFVDLVNRHDALVIGGAVAINGRSYLHQTGMRFDLPLALWPAIGRPIVMYGLSYRHWQGQEFHHADVLKRTFETAQAMPNVLLAVRNDGTLEWLRDEMKVDVCGLRVVPDPAVFVPVSTQEYPEQVSGRLNIVLAFNDEDRAQRYETPEARLAMIKEIAVAIEKMSRRWDINVMIPPHYFDDHRMIADFIDLSPPRLAHQRMISVGMARVNETASFYGRYAAADLVIAMRVHSMSPSIGIGVPMVPLVTQHRMRRFLEDIGLGDLSVEALEPQLADRLFAAVEWTLSNRDLIRGRFATAKATMRERLRAFNGEISMLLGPGRGMSARQAERH